MRKYVKKVKYKLPLDVFFAVWTPLPSFIILEGTLTIGPMNKND